MKEFRHLLLICSTLFLLTVSANSYAISSSTVDKLLNILVQTGVVDPAVNDARNLIICLVNNRSNPTNCINQAEAQEKSIDDPAVKGVVEVILAANDKDWVKVLEITGTDVLFQFVCKAGLSATGPLKKFVCGGLFQQVAAKGKPVLRQVLVAFKSDSLDEWLKAIALIGPNLACEIIPDSVPGGSQLCGTLGQVIAKVGELAGDAVDAVGDLATSAYEAVDGQSPHMSYDAYFNRYIAYSIHSRVVERLAYNRNFLGMDNGQWNTCVDYFDKHEQARDTARKTCDDLSKRLHNKVVPLVDVVTTIPQPYFDAHLAPLVRDMAGEKYSGDAIGDYLTFVDTLPREERRGRGYMHGSTSDFRDLYLACRQEVESTFPIKPNAMVKKLGPPTAWDWVCFEAVGKLFSKALAAERVRLQIEVLPRMKASGCELKNPNSWGRAVLRCNSHGGRGVCEREFQGYRKPYCETDQMAADQSLGEKMAPLLGKRCTFGGRLISCTRSWKRDLCQQILDGTLSQHQAQSSLQCVYNEKAGFKKARKQAGDILNALNQIPGQMILSNNCTRTWDDLALQCEDSKVLYELPERMPGVSLPTCLPDPNRDGSDVICYAGLYAIDLSDKKITLPSREKKIVIPGTGSASNRATGFGRSKVQRDGLPSRQPDTAKPAPGGATGFAGSTASRIKPKRGLQSKVMKNGPDLLAWNSVGAANQRTAWGRTVTVAQAPAGCRVDVLYGVKNQGTDKSPGFSVEWTAKQSPSIAPSSVCRTECGFTPLIEELAPAAIRDEHTIA